jgi:hypothetical protein
MEPAIIMDKPILTINSLCMGNLRQFVIIEPIQQ